MRGRPGSPGIDDFSGGITDLQLCARKFISLLTFHNVLLMDDDRGRLVHHGDRLDISSVLNFKLHILRFRVESRRRSLGQGVGPDRKHLDIVGLIGGSPLLDLFSFGILDDQLRAGKLFTLGDILLGDLQLRDIVLHLMHLALAVILNGELDALSGDISIRGLYLGQDVSLSDFEAGHRMRLLLGSPAISCLSILFLNNRKMSSDNFLLAGDIGLGDLDLLIDQIQLIICILLIRYGKCDRRSQDVSFRSFRLSQGVGLTDNKPGYRMGCSIGYPVVDDLSVFTSYLKMSAGDHGDLCIHLTDQDLTVDHGNALVRILFGYGEVPRIRHCVTLRSTLLDQTVRMSDDQSAYCMRSAVRYPGINQLSRLCTDSSGRNIPSALSVLCLVLISSLRVLTGSLGFRSLIIL